MKLTYFGHSCFSIETGDHHILIDPFIRPNALAANIDFDAIKADFILLTHGHADHVADAADIAQRTGATIISNFEVTNWFAAKGIEKVHPMNHGGRKAFAFGTVHYTNAIHTSSMPDGSYGGAPGGFVIKTEKRTVYHAGDTALTYDMKLIGKEYDLDAAMLPIGDNFTMGIEDAVKASKFIGCKRIIGMHYDTFDVIRIDKDHAFKTFESRGRILELPAIGGTIKV